MISFNIPEDMNKIKTEKVFLICKRKNDLMENIGDYISRFQEYKSGNYSYTQIKSVQDIVKKVAQLARLRLTGNEIEKFTPQLKEILEAFSKIDKVDTKDTKMSIQPVELKNALREDKPKECLSVEEALKNTEHKKESYFKGPRAI